MDKSYRKQDHPFVVPTADGKLIEEHFGMAATGQSDISLAHMIAPPFWKEPAQRPEFDEYTLVIRGKKEVQVNGETLIISAGQSILVKRNSEVRYANPFSEEVEYVSLCIPAFTPERARRKIDG